MSLADSNPLSLEDALNEVVKAKQPQPVSAGSVAGQVAGGAVAALPLAARAANAVAPALPAVGRVVGGAVAAGAPIVGGAALGGASGGAVGIVPALMGYQRGARAGEAIGRGLQNLVGMGNRAVQGAQNAWNANPSSPPLSGLASGMGAISAEGAGLKEINDEFKAKVDAYQRQGLSYGDAVRRVYNDTMQANRAMILGHP